MNEEEITSQSEAPAAETTQEESPAPSLDEIANEFNVEEEANQFQAQPKQSAPAYEPEPSFQNSPVNQDIPDPTYDPDGYVRYMQQQGATQAQINNTLNQLVEKVSSYEQQMAQQKVDADLGKAVSHINEKLNVDPVMAEMVLEVEYRKNPAFQKIWNNRDQNPKAFNKALDVLADKYSGNFATRTNDQLVENVRAAKTSQQTLANAPKEDPYDNVGNMNEQEFQSWWSRQKGN